MSKLEELKSRIKELESQLSAAKKEFEELEKGDKPLKKFRDELMCFLADEDRTYDFDCWEKDELFRVKVWNMWYAKPLYVDAENAFDAFVQIVEFFEGSFAVVKKMLELTSVKYERLICLVEDGVVDLEIDEKEYKGSFEDVWRELNK